MSPRTFCRWAYVLLFLLGCAPRAFRLPDKDATRVFEDLERAILPIPDFSAEGRIYFRTGEDNYIGDINTVKRGEKWTWSIWGPLGIGQIKAVLTPESLSLSQGEKEIHLKAGYLEEMAPLLSLLFRETLQSPSEIKAVREKGTTRLHLVTEGTRLEATLRNGEPQRIVFKDDNSSLILTNFKRSGRRFLPASIFLERERGTLELKFKKIQFLNKRKGEG